MKQFRAGIYKVSVLAATVIFFASFSAAPSEPDASLYKDRDEGVATSMGTYIGKHQLLIYPFYEFYWDHNTEYSPEEFGFADKEDYEGNLDEVELAVECQVHLNKHVYLKIGSGFGITPKATDIAPEIGVMMKFGGKK